MLRPNEKQTPIKQKNKRNIRAFSPYVVADEGQTDIEPNHVHQCVCGCRVSGILQKRREL